jgi:hypothetical protein
MTMRDSALYLRDLLAHTRPKLWLESGLVQLFYGRLRQIKPARSLFGMVQLAIRFPMVVSMGAMMISAMTMLVVPVPLVLPVFFAL